MVIVNHWHRPVVGALIAVAMVAMALRVDSEHVAALLAWTRERGWWAPFVLIAAYVVAAVLAVPSLLLSICAGLLFGVTLGAAVASIGSTLGAIAAFLLGRRLLRGAALGVMARRSGLARFDHGVARNGFRLVLLSRLSPVLPANVLNYALGVTRVRLRDYALASWLGMFPITLAYVYLGSTLASLAEWEWHDRKLNAWQLALYVAGLLATVAVAVLLTRMARSTIRSEEPPDIESLTAES